jgi:hypothetical protein
MKFFDEFSIEVVHREENGVVDALALSASTLQPCEGVLQDSCKMDVVFIPSIPYNIEH